MYVYLVSAPAYEWYPEYQLVHKKRWLAREFEEQILAAIEQLRDTRGKGYYCWSEAVEDVVEVLCSQHGYKRLKYQVNFSVADHCGEPDFPELPRYRGSGEREKARYARLERAIRGSGDADGLEELSL